MARLSRVVIPGVPHHVTQRGNRRERTFFEDGDYQLYLDLLADAARAAGVEVWSYCLMPNHVHLVVTPGDEEGLWRTFRKVHRHYTGYINARLRTTGHLWQGRYGSVAMDEGHLLSALRYVALNPVRAVFTSYERPGDGQGRRGRGGFWRGRDAASRLCALVGRGGGAVAGAAGGRRVSVPDRARRRHADARGGGQMG